MRHLKKFESLEKLKKEKLFLSDKDFKQAAEEFEESNASSKLSRFTPSRSTIEYKFIHKNNYNI